MTGSMTPVGPRKNGKKGFDKTVDRPVEWHFGLCFQQIVYGGVGPWLKDTGRGLAREARLSPESP
jgi:hypothetical protein